MMLGLIVRRDNTGLGYQTKAYYKHLNPVKTMVIDLSPLNHNPQNLDWYPGEPVIMGFPNDLELREFVKGLDVILTAETPYNYELYRIAHKFGVKVANVMNWEFFDHYIYPDHDIPDLIIMPSVWHLEDAEKFAGEKGIKAVYIHHPVDLEEIEYRKRTRGNPFHIAGKPAAHDRNGTMTALMALPNLRIAIQDESMANFYRSRFRHSDVRTNVAYKEVFNLGDVLVLPRKYGGNCLPLNEALASGCPVIMPDISPNNHLLPSEWLLPATTHESFTPRTKVEIYDVNVDDIRQKCAWLMENIERESERAYEIAKTISWETLKPKYMEALESI